MPTTSCPVCHTTNGIHFDVRVGDDIPARFMRCPNDIPKIPATEEEARAFVLWCETHIGGGFHPDTPGENYVDFSTDEPLFSDTDAQRFDRALDAAHALLDDIYAVSLDYFHALNNTPEENR